ncbi:hypothetical protein GCM10029992_31000 [Glycomyces albus]
MVDNMNSALEAASFVDAAMVALLLDRYASHAVAKAFGDTCATFRRPARRPDAGHVEYDSGKGVQPRGFWAGLCSFFALCCTCRMCCKERYEGPWSRKPRRAAATSATATAGVLHLRLQLKRLVFLGITRNRRMIHAEALMYGRGGRESRRNAPAPSRNDDPGTAR